MDAETVDKYAPYMIQFKVNMDTCKVSTAITFCESRKHVLRYYSCLLMCCTLLFV